jgi:hypothetical protein
MRGKIVNVGIGLLDILFSALIVVFTFYIPQDITELTVQENQVKEYLLIAIYVVMAFVVFLNFIEYILHRKDNEFKTAYLFSFFILSFIWLKEPIVAIFTLISGLKIIKRTLRENLVENSSMGAISILIVLMVAIVIISGLGFLYKPIGVYIKDKENENEQAYQKDFFKYITELDITEPYINVKKDGKYGYINTAGETVIEFLYDYASPFVKITAYNKNFEIALVCQDGKSAIILKNGRKVMTYRSESADENYDAKLEELKDIYTNTLGQSGEMQTEINKITNNISKIPVYDEVATDYTYRYDYNIEYDLIVTQSSLGMGDTYELARKDNLNIRINLDCDQIAYDENYAYIFKNGTIPFYDLSKKEQGWFTAYGKKVTMSGKAQILDFFGDKILIKNYNNYTVYFIDSNGNRLSDIYKDIYVLSDKYIVKNENSKYEIINQNFEKVFDGEYDVIDPYLVNYGLYICGNTSDGVDINQYNYAEMNFSLLNENGETIMDGIEQIYGNYYKISTDKSQSYSSRYASLIENIKDIEYSFVGDEFYSNY